MNNYTFRRRMQIPCGLFPSLLILLASSVCVGAAPPLVKLWPHGAPGPKATQEAEKDLWTSKDKPVGGRSVILLANVTDPSITIYQPRGSSPVHPAVLVFPGGGFSILALDLEGTEICEWLNTIGIAAVLVKYRVPQARGLPRYAAPLQDAQRAMSIVRSQAARWNIDPNHIGALGFSAGADLVAALSNNFEKKTYPPVDGADSINCRPDFAVLIYPAYLTQPDGTSSLAAELHVTGRTPPTFLVQSEDDPVHVENSLAYYTALAKEGVPSEMHLYSKGGHGYGLRPTGAPVNRWPADLQNWLRIDLNLLPGTKSVTAAAAGQGHPSK